MFNFVNLSPDQKLTYMLSSKNLQITKHLAKFFESVLELQSSSDMLQQAKTNQPSH